MPVSHNSNHGLEALENPTARGSRREVAMEASATPSAGEGEGFVSGFGPSTRDISANPPAAGTRVCPPAIARTRRVDDTRASPSSASREDCYSGHRLRILPKWKLLSCNLL